MKTMVDYTEKIKPYFEGIAPIEPTTTASEAHNIGNKFYLDGTLVEATANISANDTIAIGTNVKLADDVETQVDDLKQTLGNVEGENVSDNEPYILRQGKGNMVDLELVGGSLAWNQLVQNGNFASTSGILYDRGTLSTSNNVLSYTVTVVGTFTGSNWIGAGCKLTTNHKYLQIIDINTPKATEVRLGLWNSSDSDLDLKIFNTITTTNSWVNLAAIISYTKDGGSACRVNVGVDGSKFAINDVIKFRNFMLIDLTALFGSSTIADYIYSLEQATEGAGVAWFRKYFPNDYYAYVAQSMQSVNVASRKVVGKNLFRNTWTNGYYNGDGTVSPMPTRLYSEKITIPSVPTLNISLPSGYYAYRFVFFDADNNFTSYYDNSESASSKNITVPSGARYIGITIRNTAGTDISATEIKWCQLEIGTTATSYEPYKEYIYPFDSSVQLRGIPKLVDNKLSYDGDIYKADGTITRKYGIVDLGTLNWSYISDSEDIKGFYVVMSDLSTAHNNPFICSKYATSSGLGWIDIRDKEIGTNSGNFKKQIIIKDSAYTDAATFKTAMSGVYLVYELATPTTESANPYQNPQSAFSDGIEEFVYDSGIAVPVGNNSVYQTSEMLPLVTEYAEGVNKQLTQNKVDWDNNAVLGVHNVFPYPFATGTKTENGVTFTNNGDGSVTVDTAGVASTGNAYFDFTNDFDTSMFAGFILDGLQSPYNSNITIRVCSQSDRTSLQDIIINGTALANNGEHRRIALRINIGSVISNVTIKPILTTPKDSYNGFTPYAMTNQQLTALKQASVIRSSERTATTGGVGSLALDISSSDAFVLNCESSYNILIPYVSNGYWYVKVLDASTMNPVNNTSITYRVIYAKY